MIHFSSDRSLNCVQLFVTPGTTAHKAGFPVHHQLPEFTKLVSIESVMPSNHVILCHILLLLPSVFPSIMVFSNESVLHIRWPKFWSFSISIRTSNEYSGLISFRVGWLDLLAVQETFESLLQYHSSKHQFFGSQKDERSRSGWAPDSGHVGEKWGESERDILTGRP